MQAVPNCPQKQTVDPAASNNDTFIDFDVTVYPIHTDHEEEWWQHKPLSEANTRGYYLWFNSADMDTNVWAGI